MTSCFAVKPRTAKELAIIAAGGVWLEYVPIRPIAQQKHESQLLHRGLGRADRVIIRFTTGAIYEGTPVLRQSVPTKPISGMVHPDNKYGFLLRLDDVVVHHHPKGLSRHIPTGGTFGSGLVWDYEIVGAKPSTKIPAKHVPSASRIVTPAKGKQTTYSNGQPIKPGKRVTKIEALRKDGYLKVGYELRGTTYVKVPR